MPTGPYHRIDRNITQDDKPPPVIVTCHGGDVYPFYGSPLKAILSAVLRRSTKVVPVSRELTVLCQGLLGSSEQKDKVSTVPMGVSLPSYDIAPAAPKIEPIKTQGVFTAIFVGRLVRKKGVKPLLDALKLLRSDDNSHHHIKLAIVGDGNDREFLESYAADSGLGDSVTFLGWRNHTHLPHLLAAADVCVVPSIHADTGDKDGLPVILLEAAASGTTIIASEIAGIPDFISHRENGLLFPPGNHKSFGSPSALDDDRPGICSEAGTTSTERRQGVRLAGHSPEVCRHHP